jgi:hypothetical protein
LQDVETVGMTAFWRSCTTAEQQQRLAGACIDLALSSRQPVGYTNQRGAHCMSGFKYAVEKAMPESASGRTATPNPHIEIMAKNAGTKKVVSFTLPDPNKGAAEGADTNERRLLVARQTRLLRAAAKEAGRGVRVVHLVTEDGQIKFTFQDKAPKK